MKQTRRRSLTTLPTALPTPLRPVEALARTAVREMAAIGTSVGLVGVGLAGNRQLDLAEKWLQWNTGRLPVLLVHGCGGNRAAMLPLAQQLRLRGGFGQVFSYTTQLKRPSIEDLAHELAMEVDRTLRRTRAPRLHLMGHSLGGIVVRHAVTHLGLQSRVASVTTLGSPHRGMPLCTASRYTLGLSSGTVRDLAAGSRYLRELDRAATRSAVRWTAVGSRSDEFVPAASARLEVPALRARNFVFDGPGHCELVFDPKVGRAVITQIHRIESARKPGRLESRLAWSGIPWTARPLSLLPSPRPR